MIDPRDLYDINYQGVTGLEIIAFDRIEQDNNNTLPINVAIESIY